MKENIIGELTIMDKLDIKPNYAALARKYGMDWRTVKKYHGGYEGKAKTRTKISKLDEYKTEITDKLKIHRITSRGVYEFLVKRYGLNNIGSYSNFIAYTKKHNLKPGAKVTGHPRVETLPGAQGQVDWKENITLTSKCGEVFVINIFHITLSFSRMSCLVVTLQKRIEDVYRGLINSFEEFGGVPKEIVFDNMSTVANIKAKPKKPTDAILRLAKDYGFRVRLCAARSPQTKGTVEAKNKVLDWIRAYDGEFDTLEDLIQIVKDINNQMNITINEDIGMSPTALFYKEKEYLQELPRSNIKEQYLCPNRYRVANDALIRYGNNKYSVDPKLINEEVTTEEFDNNLYIYYKGKLVAYHPLTIQKINYKQEHYKSLMQGKVKDDKLEERVNQNLKVMDTLLELRSVPITPLQATKSAEALITFINQSEYGRWVINNYAHLSTDDKLTFIKGMNKVLPYVKHTHTFIKCIKYSMKTNMCKTIDFDCYVNDFMAFDESEYILSDEGYKILQVKYADEIEKFIKEMQEDTTKDNNESTKGNTNDE